VTSHEELSWPLTLRQEIPNIHIFNLSLFRKIDNSMKAHNTMLYVGKKLYRAKTPTLKEKASQLKNCYNSIHCNFLFVNN
jgi:hypothetical protein